MMGSWADQIDWRMIACLEGGLARGECWRCQCGCIVGPHLDRCWFCRNERRVATCPKCGQKLPSPTETDPAELAEGLRYSGH